MSKSKTKKWYQEWPFIITIIIVFVLWVGFGIVAYKLGKTWPERGTFGDMFGSINTLFSGLAFAGVVTTLFLQRQDLEIQRQVQDTQLKDLKQQAEATVRSAKQMELQQQLLNFQIIQQTVLNLIESKRRFIQNMKKYEPDPIQGEYVIKSSGEDALIERAKEGRLDHPDIAQFINIFFYTLQYIHNSDLTSEQKRVLADILNLETSTYELVIIYDCIPIGERQHKAGLLSTYGFDHKFDYAKKYSDKQEQNS